MSEQTSKLINRLQELKHVYDTSNLTSYGKDNLIALAGEILFNGNNLELLATSQAELTTSIERESRLLEAARQAEELRQIWLQKEQITNAAYDVLYATDKPYDARTKAYKDHDKKSKDSNRALWNFNDAVRNIGQSVWQAYLKAQVKP